MQGPQEQIPRGGPSPGSHEAGTPCGYPQSRMRGSEAQASEGVYLGVCAGVKVRAQLFPQNVRLQTSPESKSITQHLEIRGQGRAMLGPRWPPGTEASTLTQTWAHQTPADRL